MNAPQLFEEGSEPLIRIISADPMMWYADKIGEKFRVKSLNTNNGGWYSIVEVPNKSIKVQDCEFGDEVGKADLKEVIKEQAKLLAEMPKVEKKKPVLIPDSPDIKPELVIPAIYPPVANVPKYVKARTEWDWDTSVIVPDLFVIFIFEDGSKQKGMVIEVSKELLKMRNTTGKNYNMLIEDYMEGKVKVEFPEL